MVIDHVTVYYKRHLCTCTCKCTAVNGRWASRSSDGYNHLHLRLAITCVEVFQSLRDMTNTFGRMSEMAILTIACRSISTGGIADVPHTAQSRIHPAATRGWAWLCVILAISRASTAKSECCSPIGFRQDELDGRRDMAELAVGPRTVFLVVTRLLSQNQGLLARLSHSRDSARRSMRIDTSGRSALQPPSTQCRFDGRTWEFRRNAARPCIVSSGRRRRVVGDHRVKAEQKAVVRWAYRFARRAVLGHELARPWIRHTSSRKDGLCIAVCLP